MQPGGSDLAAGPEAIDRASSRFVNRDPTHVVMGRRPHRDRLDRRIDPGGATFGSDGREALGKVRAECRARIEEDAMLFGKAPPDGAGDDVARFEFGAGVQASGEEIIAFCRGQIAHYKVPRYVKFVDHFPMTVTGKVQKFVMRDEAIAELELKIAKTA